MRLFNRLQMWVRALFRREDADNELRREMESHIQMEADRLLRDGATPDEARRQAMAAFGGIERFAEDVRDERGTRFLQDISLDVRLALRSIRLRPAFAIVVALTLATGIGATTAVFSWANALLLRGLPGVRNTAELFSVVFENDGVVSGVSYPSLDDLTKGSTTSVASLAGAGGVSLQLGGENIATADAQGEYVAGDYFGTLGTRAAFGRLLTASELTPPLGPQVAVISYRLWKNSFGEDTTVVSRRVTLNGQQFTIVGIAEKGFAGTSIVNETDIWIPLAVYPAVSHRPTDVMNRSAGMLIELVGRVKPGATASRVQADLRRTMTDLIATYPDLSSYSKFLPSVNPSIGMRVSYRETVSKTIRMLLGIVALVLVIACANVANLLLFRSVKRRSEFAVRRALGASAWRLLRQHVIEGLLLSFLGGVFGMVLALALVKVFAGQRLLAIQLSENLQLDWRLLAFAFTICVANGVVFGLVPALLSFRQNVLVNLRSGARNFTGSSKRARSVLTVVQLATSMALVVGALLLSRTVAKLNAVDIGFDPTNVTVMKLDPSAQGYKSDQMQSLRRELLARVSVQPGIISVSAASSPPFRGGDFVTDVKRLDYDGKGWQSQAPTYFVSPSHFRTIGLRIVAGRTFSDDEYQNSSSDAVIITRELSRRLFGESSAVGKQIFTRGSKGPMTQTVVGVVSDSRAQNLKAKTAGEYLFTARPLIVDRRILLVVKSSRSEQDVGKLVAGIVHDINSALSVSKPEPITESVARSIATEKLFAKLISLLAFLAATLAAVGLYSVISYSVAERTREIGIRIAMGAQESKIVRLVARQAGWLVAAGLALGTGGAVMLSKVLESRLFGVSRLEPAVYVGAAMLSVLIGALASTLPARIAARVNPVEALRHE
ncbi:MAG: ABC transporter permease [Gemmatimonas sp.]